MSLSWISATPKLKAGIDLINSINNAKFVPLLQHIINSKDDNIFASEELSKLEESLELNSDTLQLLIHSIIYIFKQSSKIILKPTVLEKQLNEGLNIDLDKAKEFVKIWASKTKQDFQNLESRKKLDKVSWEINIQTASSSSGQELTPHARITLGLLNVNGSQDENVILQLNQEELTQMYNALENIQNKLDFIQNHKS